MRYKGKGLIALFITASLVLSGGFIVSASDEGEVDIISPDCVVEENSADDETINIIEESVEETELIDEVEEISEEISENTDEPDFEKAFNTLASEKDLFAVINLIDLCPVYSEADTSSSINTQIPIGNTIFVRGAKITDGRLMYRIEYDFYNDFGEGYVEPEYLAFSDEEWIELVKRYFEGGLSLQSEMSLSGDGYADVLQFPAGYQSALNSLKNSHKNWVFVPLKTGADFSEAVDNEMGDKSWINKTDNFREKGYVGADAPQSGWAYATRKGVEYYMDPRNFLSESYIFQFEQLTFNKSYHTEAAIQNFLNGTFMKGTLPDDNSMTYAKAFYKIGSSQGVSPTHLASRVYQEQGKITPLISGTYAGYEGYYNYFNVSANGSNPIVNGLKYAKSQGWNTAYKSLAGGAATIGNGYIKKGQDTVYLQKFNVNPSASHAMYTHQYMQCITAPASESTSTKKMYAEVGSLNSPFVFKIPVYNNMPGFKLNKSAITINVGNQYTLTGSVNGTIIDGSKITWNTSDKSIAIVQNGVVSAIAPGTVTISATYDKTTIPCTVTVKYPLERIELNISEDTMRRPDTVVSDTSLLSTEDKKANHDSFKLDVSYYPVNTTDTKICTFVSSNTKVCKVNADGLITAVGSGTATVTARAKVNSKITAVCTINVIAPVYKVELSDVSEDSILLVGQKKTLALEYWPKDTTSDTVPQWTSSASGIASVVNGSIKGIKKGTVTITVKLNGYSDTYRVQVEPCTLNIRNKDNIVSSAKTLSFGDGIYEYLPDSEQMSLNGYTFIGWYTGENGTGHKITEDTLIEKKDFNAYPYYEPEGKGFYVAPVGDYIYTGAAIKPEVKVYDGLSYTEGNELKELELNKDYTVTYSNNKAVSKEGSKTVPTIVIKGKGNYQGTEKVYFNICAKSINDSDIRVDDFSVTYTGKTIKSVPVVSRGDVKLVKDRDYKVTYPQSGAGAYLRTGSYPVTITGMGGYSGARTVYENITPAINIASSSVSVSKIANQTYTGSEIRPSITLTYKKNPLVLSNNGDDGDYAISYYNNTDVGTASLTISAVPGSNYYGSRTVTFKITGTSISKAKVYGLTPKVYSTDEEELKQLFVSDASADGAYLMLNDSVLIPNRDYKVSYKNLNKAGNATVTITGINAYTGSFNKTYKIQPYNISGDRISMSYHCVENPDWEVYINSLEEIECQYNQGAAGPVITMYDTLNDDTKTLSTSEYKVSFSNFSTISTPELLPKKSPTVTITGKGNYTGKITGLCTLLVSDFDESKISMTAGDVVYKASKSAYKSAPVLTDINGKKLRINTDYCNVKYYYEKFPGGADQYDVTQYKAESISRNLGDEVGANDIVDAGTLIRVEAEGKGRYKNDKISATYRITKASLKSAKFKIKNKEYYNGRPVTINPEDIEYVKVGKETLQYGRDYYIDENSYANNINKGKATVILKSSPDGNYGDSVKATYSITGKTILWWRNIIL